MNGNLMRVAMAALLFAVAGTATADTQGWLHWRGPEQTGVSREKGLPETIVLGGKNHLFTIDLAGGGTPVVAGERLYALGYRGTGPDLQEILLCANARTGKTIWEKAFSDFLSDIVYDRYAIGSPTVDAETGAVYVVTSTGLFTCHTPDGKLLWRNSLMETLGRLTFTNGRTGAPTILDDLVIVRGITSNWGADGAAMDRLYAFDKKSGALVWSSSPGIAPKDNTFGAPIFGLRRGKQVLFTGSGDGSLVCINARTGEPIWRYPISAGGMNATVVLHKGLVVGVHADENLDSSDAGRMTAVRVDSDPTKAETGPPVLSKAAEAWRNDLAAVSSSPVIAGNRIYQTTKTGQIVAVDADTGKVVWERKLAPDQLHASPLFADGKLYVPMQNGQFFILKPGESGADELAKVQLAGRCIGAPSAWDGRVYVHTTEKLYCFGTAVSTNKAKSVAPEVAAWRESIRPPAAGKPVALQIIPSEVLLRPGENTKFVVRGIDANGYVTGTYDPAKVTWAKYIPPTARVKSEMDGTFGANGILSVAADARPSAGAYQGSIDGISGTLRGRVLAKLPIKEDFEGYAVSETLPTAPGEKFAYPPLPWIGARFKFDIRDLGGNKVFAKTLDNIFFQRATVFLGHPDESNYTFTADVMTDGNRRTLSTVGVINQRYIIILNGNAQEIEINSNQERIKATAPFKIQPKVWYRLKTRVDVARDGSGVVRAKAWKREEAEPAAWNLEVKHRNAHRNGAPGLFGFAPQSLFKV
ncbi:MAG: PQQ-binding-like beta-propeller repeat protein, partial [Armatimonadota bacterium]